MRAFAITAAVCAFAGLAAMPAALARGDNSENAKLCQHDGWQSLATSAGEEFKNEGACVSFAARAGTFLLADLSVAADIGADPVPVTVRNDGPLGTGLTVGFTTVGNVGAQVGPFLQGGGPPDGWTCVYGSSSEGWWTAFCSGYLAADTEAVFPIRNIRLWEVEVTAAEIPDPDSMPNNQDPTEDDYVLFGDEF